MSDRGIVSRVCRLLEKKKIPARYDTDYKISEVMAFIEAGLKADNASPKMPRPKMTEWCDKGDRPIPYPAHYLGKWLKIHRKSINKAAPHKSPPTEASAVTVSFKRKRVVSAAGFEATTNKVHRRRTSFSWTTS